MKRVVRTRIFTYLASLRIDRIFQWEYNQPTAKTMFDTFPHGDTCGAMVGGLTKVRLGNEILLVVGTDAYKRAKASKVGRRHLHKVKAGVGLPRRGDRIISYGKQSVVKDAWETGTGGRQAQNS